ncbi:MAG TPA: hypothetical protein VK582_22955 [Pyrinomonadaceae bacterium]|nr:hypothetical protein [Pyrinomonadaceae bacterium]
MKPTKTILLIVSCLCLSVAIGCSVANLKSDKASSSPTPSSQHDSGPTAGRSDSPGNEKQSEPATSNEVADELHTPAKGTDERQAIMDALREEFDNPQGSYYHPHRGSITFVVNRLQVHNGWAWMYGYPHSSDPQDSFGEYSAFLLHSQDGRWGVMRLPPMVDDPNDPEKLDYPSRKDVEKI